MIESRFAAKPGDQKAGIINDSNIDLQQLGISSRRQMIQGNLSSQNFLMNNSISQVEDNNVKQNKFGFRSLTSQIISKDALGYHDRPDE